MDQYYIDEILKLLKSNHPTDRRTGIERIRGRRIKEPIITSELTTLSKSDPNEVIRYIAQQTIKELGLEEETISNIVTKLENDPQIKSISNIITKLESDLEINSTTDRLLFEFVKEQEELKIIMVEQTKYLKSISMGVGFFVILMIINLIFG
jgi:hypothetical protein